MKLNIKDKLATKNMSRYELAKRIGVTYPTITSIYNGDSTSIKLEILEALCLELDCTPNEIIIADDENIEYNMKAEELSSKLVPIFIEMLNATPANGKPDILYFDTRNISMERQEMFHERLSKYISLINKSNKKDDTK